MISENHEERLQKTFLNINDWLKFAEAKNFGLLTLNAAFVFGIGQIDFDEKSNVATACYYVFIPIALFSFLSSLLSLFPILTQIEKGAYFKSWIDSFSNWIDKEAKFENIHFYGYLKGIDETEFESKYLIKTGISTPFNQFEKELVTQILYNSRITWLKFQLFKIGTFLFLVAMITSILAVLILKIWDLNK
jgi:hypothetical protein